MNRKTKRKKVVIFSTIHAATDVRIFHKQARSLAHAGYDVVLFAPGSNDDFLDGVRIRALGQPPSRFERILSSLRLLPAILREQADIHHFHDPELMWVGLLLRLLGKKVIYDAHEDLPKDILTKPYLPPFLRPLLSAVVNPIEKWGANRMSAVVTATDSIQRRFPGSVVLHNYPILSYIAQSYQRSSASTTQIPFVVYSGLISKIRGALEMIAAVNLVSSRFPLKFRLLAPFQDDIVPCQVLLSDMSLIVDYRGYIPMQKVYQNYAGAVAGLVLYYPCPNHIEALPNKLFEYMACGIPVIASDFPLWRGIVRDQGCGLVVNPLDVSQIADAIIYLIEHPHEAKQMARRGRELAEKKYNWESESKKLLRLYHGLLGGAENIGDAVPGHT